MRFWISGLLAVLLSVGMPVFADLQLTTEPTAMEAGQGSQMAGQITMHVNGDDFQGISSDFPVYLRVRLPEHVSLANSLVTPSTARANLEDPIYLAIRNESNAGQQNLVVAPSFTASISRWVAGERDIWLKIASSSTDWLDPLNVRLPPSPDSFVAFSLGILGSDSLAENQTLFNSGFANLPANTKDPGMSTPQPFDTLLLLDLSQFVLSEEPPQSIGFTVDAFQDSTGVESFPNPNDIDPGSPFALTVSGNTELGNVTCRNYTRSNAGADAAACGTLSIQLQANTPQQGMGTWSVVSGQGGSFSDVHDPNAIFSGVGDEIYTLEWTIDNPPCPPSSDSVVITLNANEAVAEAGPNQTICGRQTTLTGNNPAPGSGVWRIISGANGVVVNPNDPHSEFQGQPGVVYVVEWRVEQSGCSPAVDTVQLEFLDSPSVATAGGDQNVCGDSTFLAATEPGVGNGTWTIESGQGGSISNPTSARTRFSGQLGSVYVLRWTVRNGFCPENSDTVIIAFERNAITARAGSDQTIDDTVAILSANVAEGRSAQWSIVSGEGGQITDPRNPNSLFRGQRGQTYVLRWTIFQDPCPTSTDEVRITFEAESNTPPDTMISSPADGSIFRVGDLLTFRAQGTDPDGSGDLPLTFDWDMCSSQSDCLQQGDVAQISFDSPGLYRILCVATDARGLSDPSPAEITIRITNGNRPPSVEIVDPQPGIVSVLQGESATFSAEAEDPDGDPLTLTWTSEGQDTLNGQEATFTFNQVGRFLVVVTASDDNGGESSDSRIVVVSEPGNQPLDVEILEPGNASIHALGNPISFRARVTNPNDDEDEDDLSVTWLFNDGRTFSGEALNDIGFDNPGRYTATVVASHGDDAEEVSDRVTFFIFDASVTPFVDINIPGNLRIDPGDSVFFAAIDRDLKGFPEVFYNWDFDGLAPNSRQKVPGRIQFDQVGTFEISMTAANPFGVEAPTVTRTVVVQESEDETFEPNNSLEDAASIQAGTYTNFNTSPDDPVDVFRIEINRPGQKLILEVETNGLALVQILNQNGDVVDQQAVQGKGAVQAVGLPVGVYFIAINPVGNSKRMGLDFSFSVDVLNPELFLTDIRESESESSELGVVNANNEEASIQFVAYDSQGIQLGSTTVNLPAMGRGNFTVAELFGKEAKNVSWVRGDADRQVEGYLRVVSKDDKEAYAAHAGKGLATSLFVPHIAQSTNQFFTRASVVNGTSNQSSATLSSGGQVVNLDVGGAFSGESFDFVQKFGGQLPSDATWGTFSETGEQISLAGMEVFGKIDGNRQVAGLALNDARQNNPNFTFVRNNLYFTHIARNTSRFWTGVVMVNVADAEQTLLLRAFGPDGSEVGQRVEVLPPGGKSVRLAETLLEGIGSPADVDWVLVEADSAIVGYELFGTHDNKQMAGIEAGSGLKQDLMFPFISETKNAVHSLAVVNAADAPNDVTFSYFDNNGSLLSQKTMTLNPRQKFAAVIEDFFDDLPADARGGWVSVTGTEVLAGFELITGRNQEHMSAIQAQ